MREQGAYLSLATHSVVADYCYLSDVFVKLLWWARTVASRREASGDDGG